MTKDIFTLQDETEVGDGAAPEEETEAGAEEPAAEEPAAEEPTEESSEEM